MLVDELRKGAKEGGVVDLGGKRWTIRPPPFVLAAGTTFATHNLTIQNGTIVVGDLSFTQTNPQARHYPPDGQIGQSQLRTIKLQNVNVIVTGGSPVTVCPGVIFSRVQINGGALRVTASNKAQSQSLLSQKEGFEAENIKVNAGQDHRGHATRSAGFTCDSGAVAVVSGLTVTGFETGVVNQGCIMGQGCTIEGARTEWTGSLMRPHPKPAWSFSFGHDSTKTSAFGQAAKASPQNPFGTFGQGMNRPFSFGG